MKFAKLVFHFLSFLIFTVTLPSTAASLLLPDGLSVEPLDSLDITYQVVPGFDEKQPVIAGWTNGMLTYFVTTEKLPPGWLEAKAYLTGLVRDMQATGRAIELGRQGTYRSQSGVKGTFVEIRSKAESMDAWAVQFVHFLTDGRSSFVAFATVNKGASADHTFAETITLFQTAAISESNAETIKTESNESPFFGTWLATLPNPDGRRMTVTVVFKNDLSFTSELRVDGVATQQSSGLWQISGKRLLWNYLYSNPPLPEKLTKDEDAIVSLSKDRLVLRSTKTGMEHVFVHQ